ncbi:MAG: PilZ domain-containing protein [Desulfobacterales bacterium]|nr:MAG: PilZ domain-containing protein [Desulfobacterales bacterium]
MIIERRRYSRLSPYENAFAALGSNYSKVGKIKNISRGGLAFEYIAGEANNLHFSQVDIFLAGHTFYLYNFPCRMVYDIEVHVPHVSDKYIRLLTTKRCGIQFGALAKDDKAQLTFFLEAYTDSWASQANS